MSLELEGRPYPMRYYRLKTQSYGTWRRKASRFHRLKKLARLYGISIIPLYIMAGYLDESDLSEYQLTFKNTDLLNEEEKQSLQTQIDLLTKGRQVNGNGV